LPDIVESSGNANVPASRRASSSFRARIWARTRPQEKKKHVIEIHMGEPISLISPDGEEQRFSTFETARYWLRRKWPVSDDASRHALAQVEAALDCLIPAVVARKAFLQAAMAAGFDAVGAARENGSRAA
jgi:hypothetical protein